jgi:hypothetical protein
MSLIQHGDHVQWQVCRSETVRPEIKALPLRVDGR